jgi:hypothetical protein
MTRVLAMRSTFLLVCIAAVALTSNPARAAEPPKNKADGSKGGSGPGAGGAAPTGGMGAGGGEQRGGIVEMRHGANVGKWWEVAAGWETHFLVRQSDLNGYGPNKLVNYGWFTARLDITANDRVGFRAGLYQRFTADQEETGIRASDLVFSYTRTQYLPKAFILRGSLLLTAPISFASQKASVITSPIVALGVERQVGPVLLELRTFGGPNITKYSTAEGGTPNAKGMYGWYFEADLTFPFLSRLKNKGSAFWDAVVPHLQRFTLGVDAYTTWIWHYGVGTQPEGQLYPGAVADATFSSQPVQQIYGWEVFLKHVFPQFYGVRIDLSLAFAQGDPTLGYTSLLHDGVQHLYMFWRQTSQFYTSVGVRY